jgi:hypothetical protein
VRKHHVPRLCGDAKRRLVSHLSASLSFSNSPRRTNAIAVEHRLGAWRSTTRSGDQVLVVTEGDLLNLEPETALARRPKPNIMADDLDIAPGTPGGQAGLERVRVLQNPLGGLRIRKRTVLVLQDRPAEDHAPARTRPGDDVRAVPWCHLGVAHAIACVHARCADEDGLSADGVDFGISDAEEGAGTETRSVNEDPGRGAERDGGFGERANARAD